ncbi:MAG TPA: hypothetical protein VEL69_02390 [Ktedonobacteraceae bacterium]|nr:hypothetical protein [Ktedonobacteraceae bacterium]
MSQRAVGEYTGEQSRSFNPNEHLMQIKNKNGASDYLPVQWRLVWFREQCPQGTIETEMVLLDLDRETEEETYAWNQEARRSEKVIKRANGIAIFRAVVKDGKGGIATGTKSEKSASFPDFIEKAETGAIGRALAELGYGTQFAPELDEQHRLADAPVEQSADDKKRYQQRKPFVEATASVREEQGTAPMLQEVKAAFLKLFKAEKWESFKAGVLGVPVADEGLAENELVRLTDKLIEIRSAANAGGGR